MKRESNDKGKQILEIEIGSRNERGISLANERTEKVKCLYPRVSCTKKKKKKKGSRKDQTLIVFRVTYPRYEERRGQEEIKAGIVRWQRSCGLSEPLSDNERAKVARCWRRRSAGSGENCLPGVGGGSAGGSGSCGGESSRVNTHNAVTSTAIRPTLHSLLVPATDIFSLRPPPRDRPFHFPPREARNYFSSLPVHPRDSILDSIGDPLKARGIPPPPPRRSPLSWKRKKERGKKVSSPPPFGLESA